MVENFPILVYYCIDSGGKWVKVGGLKTQSHHGKGR